MHNTDIVKSALVSFNIPVAGGLYSLASLCLGGGNFTRVLRTLPSWVRKNLVVRWEEEPSPGARESAQLIIEYAVLHYDPTSGADATKEDDDCWKRREGQKRAYRKRAEQFFEILNGDPFSGELVHYCPSAKCCADIAAARSNRQTGHCLCLRVNTGLS